MVVQTIDEIRYAWLLKLIEEHGSMAALNTRLGRARNDATISQIKNRAPLGSGKARIMGNEQAREIEERLGLERGTLDHPVELTKEALDFAMAYQSLPPALKMQLQEHMALAQMVRTSADLPVQAFVKRIAQ